VQQKRIACFQEIGGKRYEDDMFVSLTIYDVPESLLREFCRRIVQPYYPGGVSDAIKDMIQKAILEQEISRNEASSPAK
jgi:hypothetical protein